MLLTKRQVMWAIITVTVLGLGVTGFLALRPQQIPARAATHAAASATIAIDAKLGETFAPAPPSAAPALTAQQAWQRYAHHLGSRVTTIPAHTTARLGLFTLPVGTADNPAIAAGADKGLTISSDEAYSSLNQLAYGYSSHSCPLYVGGPGMQPPPPTPCIEWLFLDANTGQMIIETWQTYAPRS